MGADVDSLYRDNKCFACGRDNPIGLKADIRQGDKEASFQITLGENYQGWPEIAHGGIVAVLLDEAMAYAMFSLATGGVTMEMNVRYKAPTPTQKPILARGWVVEHKRRVAVCQAQITDMDGKVLAEATGRYLLGTFPPPGSAA